MQKNYTKPSLLQGKFIYPAIKILLGLALGYILFEKLSIDFTKVDFTKYCKKLTETSTIFQIIFAILLMPFNWLLESIKWKLIISASIEKMSLKTAIRSVITGVAFGNLAPGRATEFAGKILFISEGNRIKASFLHFVSGSSQLIVTIVFGVIAFFITGVSFFKNEFFFFLFAFLLCVLFIFLCSFFFNPSKAFLLLQKVKFFQKFLEGKMEIERKILNKLFLLSVIRHLVFSFQYFLIIKCLFYSQENFYILNGIFLSYLLMSVIPMFSPAEAFIRGGIGVLIFSSVEQDSMKIFIASTLIWLINIVIPSLLGYFIFVFKQKNSKTPKF